MGFLISAADQFSPVPDRLPIILKNSAHPDSREGFDCCFALFITANLLFKIAPFAG